MRKRLSFKIPVLLPFLVLSIGFILAATPGWAQVKSVDLSTAISQVAQKSIPSVVAIEVTESKTVSNPLYPFSQNPFFRRFFHVPRHEPPKVRKELKGLGSGMILDAQGNILTNYHVAGEATKMEVILANGDRYPAKLVGGDSKTDLAVIRIEAKEPLQPLKFGDSDKVIVGEWVVAIGSPRALEKTVTQGIISAMHRRGISEPTGYQDFLQTDAALNPGNSGGPLLNLSGEVIGINSAIATESGGFEGIGFTIPSNMAVYVSKALLAHGKVERAWLGVTIRDVTPERARALNLKNAQGALVVDVVKGGPADRAGLRPNDVIVDFQGNQVPDSAALRNDVATTPIGQQVKITVLRNGNRQDLTARTGSLEEGVKAMAAAAENRLGVQVRPLNQKETDKYGLDANEGVVITSLDPQGPMAKAGFEVNDVIVGIDSVPVAGLEGFVDVVSSLKPDQKITVEAVDHRTGQPAEIQVALGSPHPFQKSRENLPQK